MDEQTLERVRASIKKELEARNLNHTQLADMIGTKQQNVSRFLSGEVDHSRFLSSMLAVLDIEAQEPTAVRTPIKPANVVSGAKDLPVYASAQGGPGDLTFTQDPIDYVVRPDPLQHVRDGYAIYIVGDSMSPAYEHGDLALVHPHRPFRPTDDVLIYREEGHEFAAIIKRLVKATAQTWTLKQFNPAKELSLDRGDWPKCHVIVGNYRRR